MSSEILPLLENEDKESETKCHRRWLAPVCVVSIGVILGLTVAIHSFRENSATAGSDVSDTDDRSNIHNASHPNNRLVSSPNVFVLKPLYDYVLDKQLPYNVGLDLSHFESFDDEITDCQIFSNVEEYVGFSSNISGLSPMRYTNTEQAKFLSSFQGNLGVCHHIVMRKKATILRFDFQTLVPGLFDDVLNGNFRMFFEKYGTHFTSEVILGGQIVMELRFSKDDSLYREKILDDIKRFFVERITSENVLKPQHKLLPEKYYVYFSAFGGIWKSIDQYADWKASIIEFPYNFISYSPLYSLFHNDSMIEQGLRQMFSNYTNL